MAKKPATIQLAPVHPGEILREEFLNAMEVSINGLARYFRTSAEMWLGLHQDYELDVARDTAAERIMAEVLPRAS